MARQNSILEFVGQKGVSGIKNRLPAARAIADDDPLRTRARELVLSEIEDIALCKLLNEQRRVEAGVTAQQARAERMEADAKAQAALWKSAKVGTVDGMLAFFTPASAVNIVLMGRRGTEIEVNPKPEDVRDPVMTGATFGLRPRSGHYILTVADEQAKELGKRHAMPKTLSWSSIGFTSWVFTGPEAKRSIGADGVYVFAPGGGLAGGLSGDSPMRNAPLIDPKWITPPSKVGLAGGGLPAAPTMIATAVDTCTEPGVDPVLLRRLILGGV